MLWYKKVITFILVFENARILPSFLKNVLMLHLMILYLKVARKQISIMLKIDRMISE